MARLTDFLVDSATLRLKKLQIASMKKSVNRAKGKVTSAKAALDAKEAKLKRVEDEYSDEIKLVEGVKHAKTKLKGHRQAKRASKKIKR